MTSATFALIALASGAGFIGALFGLGGGMFIVACIDNAFDDAVRHP